uniref:Myb-like domain-containing protein n=1 Tax=Trichogramma kaykai TaxID=54128 RepID=A0ABD2W0I0_9HYME
MRFVKCKEKKMFSVVTAAAPAVAATTTSTTTSVDISVYIIAIASTADVVERPTVEVAGATGGNVAATAPVVAITVSSPATGIPEAHRSIVNIPYCRSWANRPRRCHQWGLPCWRRQQRRPEERRRQPGPSRPRQLCLCCLTSSWPLATFRRLPARYVVRRDRFSPWKRKATVNDSGNEVAASSVDDDNAEERDRRANCNDVDEDEVQHDETAEEEEEEKEEEREEDVVEDAGPAYAAACCFVEAVEALESRPPIDGIDDQWTFEEDALLLRSLDPKQVHAYRTKEFWRKLVVEYFFGSSHVTSVRACARLQKLLRDKKAFRLWGLVAGRNLRDGPKPDHTQSHAKRSQTSASLE